MNFQMKPDLSKVIRALDKYKGLRAAVMPAAFKTFKDITPVRTGNAKNNTRLKGNVIEADYAYAGVLDKGRHMTSKGMRGSKQAPIGMSKPALDTFNREVKAFIRNLGNK